MIVWWLADCTVIGLASRSTFFFSAPRAPLPLLLFLLCFLIVYIPFAIKLIQPFVTDGEIAGTRTRCTLPGHTRRRPGTTSRSWRRMTTVAGLIARCCYGRVTQGTPGCSVESQGIMTARSSLMETAASVRRYLRIFHLFCRISFDRLPILIEPLAPLPHPHVPRHSKLF